MKIIKITITSLILLSLFSCKNFPVNTQIKTGYFRLEEFRHARINQSERIYLMCYKQKPKKGIARKQFPAGKHNLWVMASLANHDTFRIHGQTFVNIDVTLEANKSYAFNSKIKDNDLWIWIEDVDTGTKVSRPIQTQLGSPAFITDDKIRKACKSSTI